VLLQPCVSGVAVQAVNPLAAFQAEAIQMSVTPRVYLVAKHQYEGV
jgi:hypothetical protein